MKIRKWIALVVVFAMVLGLCACGRTSRPERVADGSTTQTTAEVEAEAESESVVKVPEWVYQRKESTLTTAKDERVSVNVYYDNTTSMYPYVCDDEGRSGNHVTGSLVGVMKALRVVLQQNSTSNHTYTLQREDENSETLVWQEFYGELHDKFGTKDFYTFEGKLPNEDGTIKGPLSQLYFNGGLDASDVNIVVTDLAEQGVNNTALASAINNHILVQDGSAVGMVAFMADYNGEAVVPSPLEVSHTIKGDVYEERPLYLIITGPAKETKATYETLCDELGVFLKEGEDYFTEYQEIGTQVKRVDDTEVVVAPVFQEMASNEYAKELDSIAMNDTLGYLPLDRQAVKELFPQNLGNDGYLNISLNAYQAATKKQCKTERRVLNYYVPLYGYDETLYRYRLAESLESEKSADSTVDAILEQKDYLKYSMLQNSGTKKSPQYLWQEGNKSEFDATFNLTHEVIDGGTLEGAELSSDKRHRELAEEDKIDLTSCDKWLKITVESTSKSFPAQTIVFDIPVYACVLTKEIKPLPDWVEEFNVGAGQEEEDYLTHTFNLTGFVSTLFALNMQEAETVYQAKREVKIADVVVALTDLKTR